MSNHCLVCDRDIQAELKVAQADTERLVWLVRFGWLLRCECIKGSWSYFFKEPKRDDPKEFGPCDNFRECIDLAREYLTRGGNEQ